MAYKSRWQKAAIISLLCHIFFFASAGYLSAHVLSTPVIPEQYVELELMNESQVEVPHTPTQAATAASPIASNPSLVKTESITSTVKSTPTTSVSSMSMAYTDSPSSTTTDSASGETSSNNNPTTNGASSPSSGSKGKSGGIIPPSIVSKTDPPYPQSARQDGQEGTVVLKIEILENGRAGNISVSRSSGHESLDNAAVATLREWRFAPAKDRDSGHVISCYTTLPISFRLH